MTTEDVLVDLRSRLAEWEEMAEDTTRGPGRAYAMGKVSAYREAIVTLELSLRGL